MLKPRGQFGIYDVMRTGEGDLAFSVPWAVDSESNELATASEYKTALEAAGFRIVAERNRRDFAVDFFAQLQTKAASADGPPPLGIHLLMGDTAGEKVRDMVGNIARGLISPVELIVEKAG